MDQWSSNLRMVLYSKKRAMDIKGILGGAVGEDQETQEEVRKLVSQGASKVLQLVILKKS